MEIVTVFNFIAVFIAMFGSISHKERGGLLCASILLIFFYSIRTDYGNDIPAYMEFFKSISHMSFSELLGVLEYKNQFEPGWIVLNFLFRPFGWQAFIAFLTIFQFSAVYFLIIRYVSPKYYWIAFAFYVLDSSLLLTSLSMLRQALAMHIVVFAIPLVLKKRYIASAALILLATTMHTSAIVMFVLLTLPYMRKMNSKALSFLFLSLFVLLMVLDSFVGDILNAVISVDQFNRYMEYDYGATEGTIGLGVIIKIVSALWLIKNSDTMDEPSKVICLIYCLSIIVIPFVLKIPMIARVSIYLSLFSIPVFPKFVDGKKDYVGLGIFVVLFVLCITGYFGFFNSPIWTDAFSVYKTIFD